MDDVMPAAAIAPGITPTPPPPETLAVNFHTDVKFPVSVQRRQINWLIVRLRLQKPETTAAAGVVPVEFTKIGDEEPPPEYLTVRVLAPDFDEETRRWERTITVRYDQDSDPAVFSAQERRAWQEAHRHRLPAQGAAGGQRGLHHRSDGDSERRRQRHAHAQRPRHTGVRPLRAHAAATRRFAPACGQEGTRRTRWPSISTRRWPPCPFATNFMGETPLTSKDPFTFLTQELDPLDAMVAALTADLTEQERASMPSVSSRCWPRGCLSNCCPHAFREAYFTQIVPLRDAGAITTFLITSDEPWIPWELLKPYHYSVSAAKEYTDDFWAVRFCLSRWLAGRGPNARVEVKTAALVLPDVGLPAVADERAFFDDLSTRRKVQLSGPSMRRQEVLDLFTAGGFQVLHIATHGQFNAEDADQSVIELADDTLRPGDLRGALLRGIRQSMPLVFLNACDGGRANFGLTGLGGWAEKLFQEANAAAFVGALWEVHDRPGRGIFQTFLRPVGGR
jgi:hypothetical protein